MSRPIQGTYFRPIHDNVFVTDLDDGPYRTPAGLIIPDDKGSERGIRPRWGRIWAVGPEVDDLRPGTWVLIQHGRWTTGIDLDLAAGAVKVWKVEYPDGVLLASADDPRATRPQALPDRQRR